MGIAGKEKCQEDNAYYEKVSFELNILVCGNYNEGMILKDLKDVREEDKEYKKTGNHNLITEWKYFFFEKSKDIGEKTFKFIEHSILCDNKYNNLILFYSGLKNYSYENLLEYYDNKVKPNYHPGILIIAKQDENIILPYLNKFNKNFIKKSTEDNLIDILINIIQFASYYNQLGDEIGFPKKFKDKILLEKDNYLMTKYLFTINILLCGRPGCGKSTLINKILGKERCYARKGKDTMTNNIIKYIHEKYPLVLYDSPGFVGAEDIERINKLIEIKQNALNKDKNSIHCIFYVLNKNSERGFFLNEYEFISNLIKQKMDVFIVTTHAETEDKSDEYIEATKIQIFQNSNGDQNLEDLKNDIYPVELINNEFYTRFGLKKLFGAIYERYAKEKISYEITPGNVKEIPSKFLHDILTKKNLKIYLSALSTRIKVNFKLLASSLGTDADVKGTTMLSNSVIKIISNIYNHKISTDESLEIIKYTGYTNEIESEDSFIRKIEKGFASIIYFNGPAAKEVDYIANYLINKYNREIDNDLIFYKFLNDYRIAINNAIDSFNEINDEDNE